MTQESIDPVLNKSNFCEAIGCFAVATITIEVKIGERRKILLALCNKCVNKFEDDGAKQT
jgi:hypothetical protein